jgi:DNA polymerase III, beta subunit
MKIDKSEIAGKLAKLKSIIPSKPAIESMKGILVKNGTLTANNLEMALRTNVDCDADEQFIIPQRAIEMIESLPDGDVEITAQSSANGENDTIVIRTETISNRFQSFPPQDYPDIPELESASNVGVDSEGLLEAISSIMYSVGTTCNRPAMNGMLFEGDGENLNLVGCDGYRVAWAQLKYPEQIKMIVPRAAVNTFLGLGISGKVDISYNKRGAIFVTAEYAFYSRLLEGEFVDYRKTFPKHTNNVVIDRRSFLDSIKRSAICAEDKGRPQVIMDLQGESMKITTHSALGEYAEDLHMDTSIDEAVRIAFNARYLMDCIKSYRGVGLDCSFGGSSSPMVVDDGEIKSLVLPVRMSGN